ncbi:hypothetical protein [Streptomyces roseoverticillatus]|uniref:Uncharacterized protein n=1 Tax=Streptomyces roseoverticillatus TaxID=66429 RepID=A0ABV3IX83_9ACTN
MRSAQRAVPSPPVRNAAEPVTEEVDDVTESATEEVEEAGGQAADVVGEDCDTAGNALETVVKDASRFSELGFEDAGAATGQLAGDLSQAARAAAEAKFRQCERLARECGQKYVGGGCA